MDEIYLVPRAELLELLEARHRLAALECGGVDNWYWYCDSMCAYLKNYIDKNKHMLVDDRDPEEAKAFLEDFDFYNIAEFELECLKYEKEYVE